VICSVVYYGERTPLTAPSEVRSSSRSNNKSVSKSPIWVERRNFYGAVSLSSREQDLIRISFSSRREEEWLGSVEVP